MRELEASQFFDLEGFFHKELFSTGSVWEALNELPCYLSRIQLGRIEGEVSEGVYLVNPETITIGAGAIVEPGAYIKGPCVIGERTVVRHGAYLRGGVITGSNCILGHSTEVKNSILLNGAKAAHFAYVGDSILGRETNLGAGTKCANLRFDNREICIAIHGQRVETGRRKLGLILGDGSQTGCNAVTNPGTLVEPGVFLPGAATSSGWVNRERVING